MRTLEGFYKGVNLGGWLSQGTFDKEHLDTFITEEDIKLLASWGLDHVRLPLDYENVEEEDGTTKESGYVYVDNCIEWCQKYNLNLVLDVHKTYGYIFDDQTYSCTFFDDEYKIDRFYKLWDKLSARYAKYQDMIMFELLNEVVKFDVVDKWNTIANTCISIIRKNAPVAKILYGGVGYNAVTSIKYLTAPIDENIVYNFHCYEPMLFTHQTAWWVENMPLDFHINYPESCDEYLKRSAEIPGCMVGALADKSLNITSLGPDLFETIFMDAIKVAEERNAPIYCGEYGVIDQAPVDGTLQWFKDINSVFTKYNIGRACWTYKEKDFGLCGEHYAPIIDELVKYL